jgi:hypothetical protein
MESLLDPHYHSKSNPAYNRFRGAVRIVSTRAMAALPDRERAIERAVQIIVQGDVFLRASGTAEVQSQSGRGLYVVNGAGCSCKDGQRHPKRCKHYLARGILLRAQELLAQ